MPRGVYDRSKTKAQREAEKKAHGAHAAPATKVKGKPGRKPGSVAKSASAKTSPKTAEARVSYGNDALNLFSTVRANLETLNTLADKFGDIPTIKTEIAAHVDVISSLRRQVFGTGESQASTETVAETSNGTTAATAPQFAQSVPMPPAPIPSIPATH